MGTVLGLLAFAIIAATGVQWFRLMNAVRIPKDLTTFRALNGAGALLGVAALVIGAGTLAGTLAAIAAIGGLGFLALAAASGQVKVVPAVAVGGSILDFAATDDEGKAFDLASLRGKPFLLKFFRGHW